MTVKLKTPDGWLHEECIVCGSHLIEDGKPAVYRNGNRITDHSADDAVYTGRFCFEYLNGKKTRMYTKKTAPKWLLNYYRLATE